MPAAAQAQDKSEALFTSFEGTWTATGNAFAKTAQSEMIWTRDLNGKFFRIDYKITIPNNPRGNFRGIGYYKMGLDTAPAGFWVDTGGDLHPLASKIKDNAVTTIWGKAGSKQGRSRYHLRADGMIEVTDWILTEKGWHQFNNTVFSKK